MGFIRTAIAFVVSLLAVSAFAAERFSKVVAGEYVIQVIDGVPYDALAYYGVNIIQPLEAEAKTFLITTNYNSERQEKFYSLTDESLCVELVRQQLVATCAPNIRLRTVAIPNDPFYSQQWGMGYIQAQTVWDVPSDANYAVPVVAVIDTGVDFTHPDLAAQMWVNPGEIPGNGIDDDANGIIDDIHGANVINNTGFPMDDNGHGTHVAGIIAAIRNNSQGVSGVAERIKIIALKAYGSNGGGDLSDSAEAIGLLIDYKQRYGLNIVGVNASWESATYVAPLDAKIGELTSLGVPFIAAAGNNGVDSDIIPAYPASFTNPNITSVASLDFNGALSSFSNYGVHSVDLAAPGGAITSTGRNGGYITLSGTSMAVPHVVGAIAALSSVRTDLAPLQIVELLKNSGREQPNLVGVISTGRVIDVARAIGNIVVPVVPGGAPPFEYKMMHTRGTPYGEPRSGKKIISEDEEKKRVRLPAGFHAFGKEVDQVTISSNGVVYFGAVPDGLDFLPGTTPPSESIAVLHADLDPGSSGGVYLHMSREAVTINWYVQKAYIKGPKLWTQLIWYKNGIFETAYKIPSGLVQHLSGAAVGLRGRNTRELYAVNKELSAVETVVYEPATMQQSLKVRLDFGGGRVSNVRRAQIRKGALKVLSPRANMHLSVGLKINGHVACGEVYRGIEKTNYKLRLPGDREGLLNNLKLELAAHDSQGSLVSSLTSKIPNTRKSTKKNKSTNRYLSKLCKKIKLQ